MTHTAGHPASSTTDEANAERREMLATIDRFIVKHYGAPCQPSEPGCPCCIAWKMRDALAMAISE